MIPGTWTVPRCFAGQTVAILASGPSMSQAVADTVRHLPVIVINSTFRLAPWAWMLYAADGTWWRHRENRDAQDFAGLKLACDEDARVPYIGRSGTEGFDPDPRFVRTGRNSGYQALHIAVQSGAARVLLCGYDMSKRQGAHWHGEHPRELKITTEEHYGTWIGHFNRVAPIYAKMGVDVVNVTPGSALGCFRSAPLGDALAEVEAQNAAVPTGDGDADSGDHGGCGGLDGLRCQVGGAGQAGIRAG